MMDVSLPPVAPHAVADLRPAADAAASARIDRPPSALAPGLPVTPVSLAQEGLVTRGFMEPAASAAPGDLPPGFGEAPQRVLKPWGVLMLPTEKRDKPPKEAAAEAAPEAGLADPSPDATTRVREPHQGPRPERHADSAAAQPEPPTDASPPMPAASGPTPTD